MPPIDDERPEGAATDAPDADGAEEARTDAPTGADDGDANGKVSIPRHEYNAIREAREQAKALEQENARLRAEAESRRTPPTAEDSKADDLRSTIAEEERYIAMLERAAKDGNENAAGLLVVHRASLRAHKETLASEERMTFRMEMQDIPEVERQAVFDYMKQTGVTRPSVARQLMRGGKPFESLAEENARLKAELENTKKGRAQKPVVEDTRIVGSPGGARAPAAKGKPITLDEYHRRMREDPEKTIAERQSGAFTIQV